MTDINSRIERKVALAAAEKRMTVGELRQFVQALDEAHVPDGTSFEVRTNITGGIKKIEV